MQRELRNLAERGRSRRQREVLDGIKFLLSKQALMQWRSFLKEMCRGDGKVANDVYSMFTFEPLYSPHLAVSRLLKTSLIQYLCLDEIRSHPGGPARKQKRLRSVSLTLFKAFIVVLAHKKEKRQVPGFHVDFLREANRAADQSAHRRRTTRYGGRRMSLCGYGVSICCAVH